MRQQRKKRKHYYELLKSLHKIEKRDQTITIEEKKKVGGGG